MSTAAQREDTTGLFDLQANGTDGTPALRDVAAERLASHRRRASVERARQAQQAELAVRERGEARRGSSRVRDAVAARYQAAKAIANTFPQKPNAPSPRRKQKQRSQHATLGRLPKRR